jgi:16S rRNA (adenine1518-N6/adenine1519-N6)-dimethyltransferase
VISRDQLTQLLEQLEINPQVRAEDLSVEQWVNLTNLMEITDLVTD